MRTKIIAGNWKMNPDYHQAKVLFADICKQLSNLNLPNKHKQVVVFPPYLYIENFLMMLKNQAIKDIHIGAQNCHQEYKGAFTGEVSAQMLAAVGCKYVLIGHSERRIYFNEDNNLLSKKIKIALENKLTPIYCCGETLTDRENNHHFQVVEKQISEGLFDLNYEKFEHIVIAYEPVWAIGTGKTASPEQAEEMHAYIREVIAKQYGNKVAICTSILYGGSCNPTNAEKLFSQKNIDGGLVGGASLNAEDFYKIILALPS